MIDKRTLNNEIVAMRKVVKQAKVQIIHKLSREIKTLRSKEGPDEIKSKNNRKADRKRDEIFAIKKLKVDDISKFALKNQEDPIKMIGNQGVNLELRAYFRFAASKVLSARIIAFREQYPDWKDCIHEQLDTLGIRRKNLNQPVTQAKVVNPPPNSQKAEKSPGPKQIPEGSCVKDSNNMMDGKLGASKDLSPLLKRSNFLSQWSVEAIRPVVDKVGHADSPVNGKLKSDRFKNEVSAVPSFHKAESQSSTVRKSSGIAEVKRFHELCDTQESAPMETKESPVMDEASGDSDDDGSDGSDDGQAVDPFFVKSDGKTGYVTKMVVEEEDNEEEEKGSSPPFGWGGRQSRGGRGHHSERGWSGKDGARGGRGGGRGFRGGRGSFSDRGQPKRSRGGFGGERPWSEQNRKPHSLGGRGHDQGPRFAGKSESARRGNSKFAQKTQPIPAEDGAHLHPSWEAKRKLKEQSISTVAFQGKKIKFDDDD